MFDNFDNFQSLQRPVQIVIGFASFMVLSFNLFSFVFAIEETYSNCAPIIVALRNFWAYFFFCCIALSFCWRNLFKKNTISRAVILLHYQFPWSCSCSRPFITISHRPVLTSKPLIFPLQMDLTHLGTTHCRIGFANSTDLVTGLQVTAKELLLVK
jgi:hypothetical protein